MDYSFIISLIDFLDTLTLISAGGFTVLFLRHYSTEKRKNRIILSNGRQCWDARVCDLPFYMATTFDGDLENHSNKKDCIFSFKVEDGNHWHIFKR